MEKARCSLKLPEGSVSCEWQRSAQGVELAIQVPEGTEAEFFPLDGGPPLMLSGGIYRRIE
jgi:hypothetical protein